MHVIVVIGDLKKIIVGNFVPAKTNDFKLYDTFYKWVNDIFV